MTVTLPFIPGHIPPSIRPLGRYLPPIPDGVVTAWLARHIAPGEWVLDPFGASPRAAVEAARVKAATIYSPAAALVAVARNCRRGTGERGGGSFWLFFISLVSKEAGFGLIG